MDNILTVLGIIGPILILGFLACGLGHVGNDKQSVLIKKDGK